VPAAPIPFSTPRSWTLLSRALDLAEQAGLLDVQIRRALVFGRVSPEDAAIFCAMVEDGFDGLLPLEEYLRSPSSLPASRTARWFVLCRVRQALTRGSLPDVGASAIAGFLRALSAEDRSAVLVDLVEQWGALGADEVLLDSFRSMLRHEG
jgi:hypothetical protein